jgi:hypothetical protein
MSGTSGIFTTGAGRGKECYLHLMRPRMLMNILQDRIPPAIKNYLASNVSS